MLYDRHDAVWYMLPRRSTELHAADPHSDREDPTVLTAHSVEGIGMYCSNEPEAAPVAAAAPLLLQLQRRPGEISAWEPAEASSALQRGIVLYALSACAPLERLAHRLNADERHASPIRLLNLPSESDEPRPLRERSALEERSSWDHSKTVVVDLSKRERFDLKPSRSHSTVGASDSWLSDSTVREPLSPISRQSSGADAVLSRQRSEEAVEKRRRMHMARKAESPAVIGGVRRGTLPTMKPAPPCPPGKSPLRPARYTHPTDRPGAPESTERQPFVEGLVVPEDCKPELSSADAPEAARKPPLKTSDDTARTSVSAGLVHAGAAADDAQERPMRDWKAEDCATFLRILGMDVAATRFVVSGCDGATLLALLNADTCQQVGQILCNGNTDSNSMKIVNRCRQVLEHIAADCAAPLAAARKYVLLESALQREGAQDVAGNSATPSPTKPRLNAAETHSATRAVQLLPIQTHTAGGSADEIRGSEPSVRPTQVTTQAPNEPKPCRCCVVQ
jgi:hypothetical protein